MVLDLLQKLFNNVKQEAPQTQTFNNQAFYPETVTLIPEISVAIQCSVIYIIQVTFVLTQKVGFTSSK